jgi:hypothetical protein
MASRFGSTCRWALGRARNARIDTELCTGCSRDILTWFAITTSRSRVCFLLGLVRARCVVRPWIVPVVLVSTPNFIQAFLRWYRVTTSRARVRSSLGLVRALCAWVATNRSHGRSRAWFLVVLPGGQTSWTCCLVARHLGPVAW